MPILSSTQIDVTRTFHPIGQGAFYTEKFSLKKDGSEFEKYYVVYDCGSGNRKRIPKILKDDIYKTFSQKEIVKYLFISHFHNDHINGVEELINYCDVQSFIVPILTPDEIIESYIYNYITTRNSNNSSNRIIEKCFGDSDSDFPEIIKVDKEKGQEFTLSSNQHSYWKYIIYNSSKTSPWSFSQSQMFRSVINNRKVDFRNLRQIFKKHRIKDIQKEYDSITKNKNADSLLAFSGPTNNVQNKLINCLFCGDFEAKNAQIMQGVLDYYSSQYQVWNNIGILQVPHHGSQNNINSQLYQSQQLCIMSAEPSYKKPGHPDQLTINEILKQNAIPIIVSRSPKTIQQFKYTINI